MLEQCLDSTTAITASTHAGQSGPFIDFMLDEIHNTLKAHQGVPLNKEVPNRVPNKVPNKLKALYLDLSDAIWDVYSEIKRNPQATAEEIGTSLGVSSRMVRKYIATLREHQIIERIGSNKTGCWKILKK